MGGRFQAKPCGQCIQILRRHTTARRRIARAMPQHSRPRAKQAPTKAHRTAAYVIPSHRARVKICQITDRCQISCRSRPSGFQARLLRIRGAEERFALGRRGPCAPALPLVHLPPAPPARHRVSKPRPRCGVSLVFRSAAIVGALVLRRVEIVQRPAVGCSAVSCSLPAPFLPFSASCLDQEVCLFAHCFRHSKTCARLVA